MNPNPFPIDMKGPLRPELILRFLPMLQRVAANDPDEIVRQDATTLIQNLQKYPQRSIPQ